MTHTAVALFKELVAIDAPTCAETPLADHLKRFFENLPSFRVFTDEAGKRIGGTCGNLMAMRPGAPELPPLLFSAHMDTIASTRDLVLIEEKGVFKTDGATILGADDRAGIAILLAAAQHAETCGATLPELRFVFTVAEETGLLGSKQLDVTLLGPDPGRFLGFVLDSAEPAGTVVARGPYGNRLSWTIHGRAAHAGIEPEKGVNAIAAACAGIAAIPQGRVDPESTVNIGMIKGGTAVNIVSDRVAVSGEVRSFREDLLRKITDQASRAMDEAARRFGAEAEFVLERDYVGFTVDCAALWALVREAGRRAGLDIVSGKSCGASDANVFNERGIACVNLGLGICGAHSTTESIERSSIEKAARLVIGLLDAAAR